MNSILNSISPGDLQAQKASRDKPVNKDSIIELLQNSEIEFKTCSRLEEKLFEADTGFGFNNDLYYETPCAKPKLSTPLYQENFLSEFVTEEEKAAARHALGLYNKGDVVALSLLTTEASLPTKQDWEKSTIKQMKQGDLFFTPITSFRAVYDGSGSTLDTVVNKINSLITQQKEEIAKINNPSNSTTISSLGDVKTFLNGFNNGENLHDNLEDLSKEMLRFELTGQMAI